MKPGRCRRHSNQCPALSSICTREGPGAKTSEFRLIAGCLVDEGHRRQLAVVRRRVLDGGGFWVGLELGSSQRSERDVSRAHVKIIGIGPMVPCQEHKHSPASIFYLYTCTYALILNGIPQARFVQSFVYFGSSPWKPTSFLGVPRTPSSHSNQRAHRPDQRPQHLSNFEIALQRARDGAQLVACLQRARNMCLAPRHPRFARTDLRTRSREPSRGPDGFMCGMFRMRS